MSEFNPASDFIEVNEYSYDILRLANTHHIGVHDRQRDKDSITRDIIARFATGNQVRVFVSEKEVERSVSIDKWKWWEHLAVVVRHFCPNLNFGWLEEPAPYVAKFTAEAVYNCYNVIPSDAQSSARQVQMRELGLPIKPIPSNVAWLESEPATPGEVDGARQTYFDRKMKRRLSGHECAQYLFQHTS